MSSQSDLESKASRVLVVGGSCAIGRAVARSFACDGWKVTTTYRACNPLNETDSDTCSLDLMWDRGAMDAFVEFDRAKHGGKCPNVVVVCAAGIEPVALGSIDVDLFEKHYHTIVRGPLFLIQVRQTILSASIKADYIFNDEGRHCIRIWSQIRASFSFPLHWPGRVASLTIAMQCMPLPRQHASSSSSTSASHWQRGK